MMLIIELFLVVKTWNQPKCLWLGEWLKKMGHIYTVEYYLAENKLNKTSCSNGLPWWLDSEESASQCRRFKFNSWIGNIPLRRKWNSLQYSCLGNPRNRGAWWATVHGIAKSQTLLSNENNNKFLATWMGLENLILTKESQKRKINTIWYYLHLESKIWHKRTSL